MTVARADYDRAGSLDCLPQLGTGTKHVLPSAPHYLAETMIPPAALALDRLRIVLRHRNEGAGGSSTITAAPLEQRYAPGFDCGREPYDAEANVLLRHCHGQDCR